MDSIANMLDTIICGDCLQVMRDMDDNSVDLVLTDPPYFLPAQHYNTRRQFRRNFSDLGILEHFFRDFFAEVERILKQDGYLYCFCDGQSYPLFYYYAYFFVKAARPLIWDKCTSINGYAWRHQHELLLFGQMPTAKPIPTGDGDIIQCRAVPIDNRLHPAEKPISLLSKIIKKHTAADIVFDGFCGSGAVCASAVSLGRHFIGIEISPDYCKIAEKRIQAERDKYALFDTAKGGEEKS